MIAFSGEKMPGKSPSEPDKRWEKGALGTKQKKQHFDIWGKTVEVCKREGEVHNPIGDIGTASECQNNGGLEGIVADIALNA